jgi:hypothetical protein
MASPKDQTKTVTEDSEPAPTPDEIAQRAYDIFLARGEEPGHDLDDWFQAEAELLNERAAGRSRGN